MRMAKNICLATALTKIDKVGLPLKGFLLQEVTSFMAHVLCPRLLHACRQYWDRQYCRCGGLTLAGCQVPKAVLSGVKAVPLLNWKI